MQHAGQVRAKLLDQAEGVTHLRAEVIRGVKRQEHAAHGEISRLAHQACKALTIRSVEALGALGREARANAQGDVLQMAPRKARPRELVDPFEVASIACQVAAATERRLELLLRCTGQEEHVAVVDLSMAAVDCRKAPRKDAALAARQKAARERLVGRNEGPGARLPPREPRGSLGIAVSSHVILHCSGGPRDVTAGPALVRSSDPPDTGQAGADGASSCDTACGLSAGSGGTRRQGDSTRPRRPVPWESCTARRSPWRPARTAACPSCPACTG